MIVYIPVYENGEHRAFELDTEKARLHRYSTDEIRVFLHGRVYHAMNMYATKEAVDEYWHKNYGAAYRSKVKPEDCKWLAETGEVA